MKEWLLTGLALASAFPSVRADVTVVQTMTLQGSAAVMKNTQMPRMTTRIKGQKSRTDIEVSGQTTSSIIDLASKQVIILNSATRTATVRAPGSTTVPQPMSASVKPTGKSQTIDGQQCDEHALSIRLNLADMTGPALAPEAIAMMKDARVVMDGSIWIAASAPGTAEYAAFNKAALGFGLLAGVMGMSPVRSGGFDNLIEAAARAPGLPCLMDVTMVYEGTGPIAAAAKQTGPVRLIQKLASVTTDPIADDIFNIPEGYKVEKK